MFDWEKYAIIIDQVEKFTYWEVIWGLEIPNNALENKEGVWIVQGEEGYQLFLYLLEESSVTQNELEGGYLSYST